MVRRGVHNDSASRKMCDKNNFPHATCEILCVNASYAVYFRAMTDPTMTESTSMDPRPEVSSPPSRSFAWYALVALALALIIRFFVAAPYVVSGASMEPTFDNWDYLITDRLSYRVQLPERGDVVVFCLPGEEECSMAERLKRMTWTAPRTLIKRVIGLPGETVIVNGTEVRIINAENPQGFVLNEPYLSTENLGGPSGTNVTLGSDEYFVMGDNRRVSSDSRVWGTLPKNDIIGRVILRLFPISHAAVLPGDAAY